MSQYYIYLRKSRADRDAELHGAGETLLRHEKALTELAARQKLNVTKIFREIVSGETIAARPQVQMLLAEVAKGTPAGVLVMEVERLARGDTKDQGTVAEAFKMGNVKIITPTKTYDPNNEFDEEYFEFGLFMSRREYKTINRRIQRGRLASVEEGKYIASSAPYGYERVHIKNEKGYTLQVIPDQAAVVRLIYELYTKGELQEDGSYRRLGMSAIAKKLDTMHIPPQNSNKWSRATIKDMLVNPTYIGKVRWQWRKVIKSKENGEICQKRQKNYNCMLYNGLHDPIIDEEVFDDAQSILHGHRCLPAAPKQALKNPLSGLVVCGLCGRTMTRINSNTKKGYHALSCPNRYCSNVSAPLYLIEEKILAGLHDWLKNYKLSWETQPPSPFAESRQIKEASLQKCKKELEGLRAQLNSTYDLLEKNIYTTEIFLQRNQILTAQIAALSDDIELMQSKLMFERRSIPAEKNCLPCITNILELYRMVESVELKNELLKEVLDKVVYTKSVPNRKGRLDNANFSLILYPKLPPS